MSHHKTVTRLPAPCTKPGYCLCGQAHTTAKRHKSPKGHETRLNGMLVCSRCATPLPDQEPPAHVA